MPRSKSDRPAPKQAEVLKREVLELVLEAVPESFALHEASPQLTFPRDLEVVGGRAASFVRERLYVPISRVEVIPPEMFSLLLGVRLTESRKLRAFLSPDAAGMENARVQLTHIHPSEGTERIADILRRCEAFAALEKHDISIDAIPNALPGNLLDFWRKGPSHSPGSFQLAHMDPYRLLDTLLPVGMVVDLKDSAFISELLQSPLYTGLYGFDGCHSWLAVYLGRTARFTWVATLWHTITSEDTRLRVRTALEYVGPAIATASARIGLLTDEVAEKRFRQTGLGSFGPGQARFRDLTTPPLPPFPPDEERTPPSRAAGTLTGRSRFVRGIPRQPGDCRKTDYGIGPEYGNVAVVLNINALAEAGSRSRSLLDWSDAALEAQAEVLKGRIEREREALRRIDEERRERLGFAGAIPISDFKARAVHLIEAFDNDPRPLVIVVSGTDRTCILKPVDTDDLPTTVVPVSRMGPQGSSLVEEAAGEGARGGTRIGIRRGGVRTGSVVAELCPSNADSKRYISVLRSLGQLG